jgi:hypothetical protein|tara:strand:- start:710 stop:1285 length:576 start_codon:yes stop_codon:yes gene_type:complete
MEQRRGLENIDQFAAAPPGIGMMNEQGGRPWERPPRVSNPEEAANTTIQKIDGNPQVKEEMLNLMSVGSPIETIVNTITFMGFVNGEWTPDTAELIKPVLMIYFIGAALENNIEASVYNVPEDEKEKTSEQDLIRMMRDFRPEEFDKAESQLPQDDEQTLSALTSPEEPMEEATMEEPQPELSGFMERTEV